MRVGVEIFQKRSQLRAISGGGNGTVDSQPPEPAFTGLRTTEVEVTTTDPWVKSTVETPAQTYARPEKPASGTDQYTITISAHDNRDRLPPTPRANLFPRRPSSMDKIKWAYTKCALLFAISILITWVPASVNRVYGLRYPKHPSMALNVGSAIVLPLQGFWNTVIYFSTSLSICRSVIARFRGRNQPRGFLVLDEGRPKRDTGKESDSTIELSHARSQGSLSDSL